MPQNLSAASALKESVKAVTVNHLPNIVRYNTLTLRVRASADESSVVVISDIQPPSGVDALALTLFVTSSLTSTAYVDGVLRAAAGLEGIRAVTARSVIMVDDVTVRSVAEEVPLFHALKCS